MPLPTMMKVNESRGHWISTRKLLVMQCCAICWAFQTSKMTQITKESQTAGRMFIHGFSQSFLGNIRSNWTANQNGPAYDHRMLTLTGIKLILSLDACRHSVRWECLPCGGYVKPDLPVAVLVHVCLTGKWLP